MKAVTKKKDIKPADAVKKANPVKTAEEQLVVKTKYGDYHPQFTPKDRQTAREKSPGREQSRESDNYSQPDDR